MSWSGSKDRTLVFEAAIEIMDELYLNTLKQEKNILKAREKAKAIIIDINIYLLFFNIYLFVFIFISNFFIDYLAIFIEKINFSSV